MNRREFAGFSLAAIGGIFAPRFGHWYRRGSGLVVPDAAKDGGTLVWYCRSSDNGMTWGEWRTIEVRATSPVSGVYTASNLSGDARFIEVRESRPEILMQPPSVTLVGTHAILRS